MPAEPPKPAGPSLEPPVVDVPWNEPPATPPVAVEGEALEQRTASIDPPEHVATVVEVSEPDDDEPPLTDEDYFEVETQAEAFLDGLDDLAPEPQAPAEPMPAVEPAPGRAAEWPESSL